MAGDKYLYNNAGAITEKEAIQSSAGAGDAGKIASLDATGKFDQSLMPVGLGSETDLIPASENLAAGDLVNIYQNAAASNVRKADASTSGKEANGFVLAAVTAPANATVYRPSQNNTQKTAMTPGKIQYLSDVTPGGTVETPPSGTGKTVQIVGIAKTATEMIFNPRPGIVLA